MYKICTCDKDYLQENNSIYIAAIKIKILEIILKLLIAVN